MLYMCLDSRKKADQGGCVSYKCGTYLSCSYKFAILYGFAYISRSKYILTELPYMGQKWGETRKWPNLTKLGWCDPFVGGVDPPEYFWSGGPPVGGAAPPWV